MQRRDFLTATAVGSAGLLAGGVRAAPADVAGAVAALTRGATPTYGRIRLDLPAVAEHGDAVPITVEVESPMTDDDHIDALHLFAAENPAPNVLTFHFTAMSGIARATTRIRLTRSQDVVALARTSNGDFYTVSRRVKVTVGCGSLGGGTA